MDRVSAYRLLYVLDCFFSLILEHEFLFLTDRVKYRARDKDATGVREAFQPRGDIDAVAIDFIAIDDDITEVDADAKQYLVRFG